MISRTVHGTTGFRPGGCFTAAVQAAVFREAIAARNNILDAGGASIGKTTLTNTLPDEIAGGTDRAVLNDERQSWWTA